MNKIERRTAPIILDVGKQKKKRIKELKNGQGDIAARIQYAVEQAQEGLGAADKTIVPVVVVYEQKSKKRSRLGTFLMPF